MKGANSRNNGVWPFDREETKSEKDHVVHDKVRLDQIYGMSNGKTMSLCSVGIDEKIVELYLSVAKTKDRWPTARFCGYKVKVRLYRVNMILGLLSRFLLCW